MRWCVAVIARADDFFSPFLLARVLCAAQSYKPPSASDLFDDAPSSGAAAAPAAAAAAAPKPSAGGNVPPQVAAFLSTPAGQAAAADPDLAPVLADIQANGMGAAMKYMQNPKVMQKITAIMGPMMGKK